MSPQFVDFDGDGRLDIVAGIFDGSPHLVRGTEKGWAKPEQILDRNGKRIVLNAFWNFDTKKWDETNEFDAPGHGDKAHMTSAVAFDWDGDGDLDLLLGDHSSGRIFRRTNEGTAKAPSFSLVNEPVHAAGKPIDVPGTVATMRLVDWNKDGLLDLACGGMGDAYGDAEGGGVYVYMNTGTKQSPAFAAPITLLQPGKKDGMEPIRPDSGIYMDFGDHDGDGDLDMVVGGYSHWQPKPVVLTAEQKARVAELQAKIADLQAESQKLNKAINEALQGLDEAAAEEKRAALIKEKRPEMSALSKQRQALTQELEPLVPGAKRRSFVWMYENVGDTKTASAAK
jgi:hypothetical protein